MNAFIVQLNLALTFTIVGVAVFKLKEQDQAAVLTFGLLVLAHSFVGGYIPNGEFGTLYYILAWISDLAIIAGLSRLSKPNQLTLQLQNVCTKFIYLNLFGWISYMLYFDPIAYNFLCAGLYVWTLVVIFRGRGTHVLGNRTMDRGRAGIFSNYRSCTHALSANEKAARN